SQKTGSSRWSHTHQMRILVTAKTAKMTRQRNQQLRRDGNISKKKADVPMIRPMDTKMWKWTKNSRKTATRMSIHQDSRSPATGKNRMLPAKHGRKNRSKNVVTITTGARTESRRRVTGLRTEDSRLIRQHLNNQTGRHTVKNRHVRQ